MLSSFDEGPDLVLYYKHLMVLKGDKEYALHFNATDALTDSQRGYAEAQFRLFNAWYAEWSRLARRRAEAQVLGSSRAKWPRRSEGLIGSGHGDAVPGAYETASRPRACRRSRCSISRRLRTMPSASDFARAA